MSFVYFKELRLRGVGFRSVSFFKKLYLKAGFTHYVIFSLPQNVSSVSKKDKLLVYSFNQQLVGEVTSKIKSIRSPDPYKFKGIVFSNQKIILKPGKQRLI